MIAFESGMLVQHASLGLGKAVAVEPTAVHVAFVAQGARVATKLRLPAALPFLEAPATPNAWLSGLSGFTLDARTGRYGRATTWLSHPDAVTLFTEAFPLAFADPSCPGPEKGRGGRATRWRRAHAAFVAALFDLLSADAPDRARFDALVASVAALAPDATPESRWPLVTLLPFLARPDVHVLLRTPFVCDGAQRLGLELVYEAEPSWATYASLLDATRQLLDRLRPLGARDHVDVEAFMHVVLAAPARPKRQARAAAPAGGAGEDEDAGVDPDGEDDPERDPAASP